MADGVNWTHIVSHGASFLDRTYALMQNYARSAVQNNPQTSAPASTGAARSLDLDRLYGALSTGHRILDALEGRPEPRRTFFW